jgi:phospholipase C
VYDRVDGAAPSAFAGADVPVVDPAAAAAAAGAGGRVRVITVGGRLLQTAVLPWSRLRAVSVERVDARAEVAALLRARAG